MEELAQDPVAQAFTMCTERLAAVEARVEGLGVTLSALARQALRSRAQEVGGPELMGMGLPQLGGARVARLLSAMEGSSRWVLGVG